MAQPDYEHEMMVWRMEDPDKFIIRICQYLSRFMPNPRKIIEGMQA